MDSGAVPLPLEPFIAMPLFLFTFADVPDPRAGNIWHDLDELLVIAFVSVLCGATSRAEMAARLRGALANVPADRDSELEAAI